MSAPSGRRLARSFALNGSAAANNRASSMRSTSPPPSGGGSAFGVSSGSMTLANVAIFPSGIEFTPPPLTPLRMREGSLPASQVDLREVLQLASFEIALADELQRRGERRGDERGAAWPAGGGHRRDPGERRPALQLRQQPTQPFAGLLQRIGLRR